MPTLCSTQEWLRSNALHSAHGARAVSGETNDAYLRAQPFQVGTSSCLSLAGLAAGASTMRRVFAKGRGLVTGGCLSLSALVCQGLGQQMLVHPTLNPSGPGYPGFQCLLWSDSRSAEIAPTSNTANSSNKCSAAVVW